MKQALVAVAAFYTIPFLFFAEDNVVEGLPFDQAAILMIVLVLLGLAVLRIARWLLKDWAKAGILTVLLSFPLFYFRTMVVELVKVLPDSIGASIVIYPLVALAAVGVLFGLRRLKDEQAKTVVSYLSVVGVVLFAYAFTLCGLAVERNSGARVDVRNADLRSAPLTSQKPSGPAEPPDIYFLVFDRYTGQIGLRETYGFDNTPFLNSLRKKGFYVATEGFSNYPFTASSLTSSLNGGLLKTSGAVKKVSSGKAYFEKLKSPQVAVSLKKAGYSVTQVGSWWGPTETSAVADENPRYAWAFRIFGKDVHVGNMTGVYLLNTMFVDFYEKVSPQPFRVEKRQGPIFHEQLETLGTIAERDDDKPRLVIAHILMPHPPYVFDRDGSALPDGLSSSQKYLRQLTYANTQITRLVDRLLRARPDDPPVIVLTADEGEYPSRFGPDAADAELRKKTNILSAFYFPAKSGKKSADEDSGERYGSLYPTITSVNYFRVILNRYLGADLPLQPDRTYTNKLGKPFVFYDVTKRVHATPGPPGSGGKRDAGPTPDAGSTIR